MSYTQVILEHTKSSQSDVNTKVRFGHESTDFKLDVDNSSFITIFRTNQSIA